MSTENVSNKERGNGVLADVIGSDKSLPVESVKEFIEHWQRIIYPVDLEHHEKRAIHTVITELETYTRVHCR